MADIFLTLKQIEKIFWNATTRILGLDPALPINASKVRIAWPTDGAPSWKINEDIVFIRVGDEDDAINILRDNVIVQKDDDNATSSTGYTRVLIVHFVCCGPNSFDNAFLIRNNLYKQEFRELFTVNNIYLIPQIKSPVRSPELFGGQWWERTNVMAKFNELVKFEETIPYLKSAIVPITTEKVTETIEVTPTTPVNGVNIIPNQ